MRAVSFSRPTCVHRRSNKSAVRPVYASELSPVLPAKVVSRWFCSVADLFLNRGAVLRSMEEGSAPLKGGVLKGYRSLHSPLSSMR